jgi:hypothetical protein
MTGTLGESEAAVWMDLLLIVLVLFPFLALNRHRREDSRGIRPGVGEAPSR